MVKTKWVTLKKLLNTCKYYMIIGRGEKETPPKWERKEMAAEMRVKDWFVGKIEVRAGWHLVNYIYQIEKETEKAYYVAMEVIRNDGECESMIRTWVPKSCTQTVEEYEAERAQAVARFEAGKEKYSKLVEWAKTQGVKGVRVGLKKDTILAKIAEAGLVAPVEVA